MKIGDQATGLTTAGEEVTGVVSAIQNNTAVLVSQDKKRHLIVLNEEDKKAIAQNQKTLTDKKVLTLLATARKDKGLSQEYVAGKLGITQNQVSVYERGKGIPNDEVLEKYAELLEIPISSLRRTNENTRPKLAKRNVEATNIEPKKKEHPQSVSKPPEPMLYPKSEKEVLDMKTEIKSTSDMVNHPPHYQIGGMETIEVLELVLTPEEYRGYLKGNIIKYRERAKHKGNEQQDYEKALWYKKRLEGMK